MRPGSWWLGAAALALLGAASIGSVRAQVVINGTGVGGSYTVPSTGVTASSGEIVGLAGTGTLTQTQATNNASGASVFIGAGGAGPSGFQPGIGLYSFSGGTLEAATETLGIDGGKGLLDQTGGTNITTTLSVLGQGGLGLPPLNGTYTLGGGSLNATSITVGSGTAIDNGVFQFNGGTADFGALQVNLGGAVNATGNEVLDGANSTHVNYSVTQAGGSNTATGALELGANGTATLGAGGAVTSYAPNTGTYTLNAGSLSAAGEVLGLGGNGDFTQTGGTNTIAPGAAASLTLSNGSTLAAGTLQIASAGYSPPNLPASTGAGAYILDGGILTAGAETIVDGGSGRGTLTQNGGTNSVALLNVSGGNYTLGGGTLNATSITVGSVSAGVDEGVFQFNGGTSDFSSFLLNSYGFVNATGNEVLDGANPTHTNYSVTQAGGLNTVTGALELGANGTATLGAGGAVTSYAPNTGTYTLNAGPLSAAGEVLGLAGTGDFTQTGGTNTIAPGAAASLPLSDGSTLAAGSLVLGDATTGRGTYQLGGGTLSAGTELVGVAGFGGFLQTGGGNSATVLELGVTSSTLDTYSLSAGTLATSAEVIGLGGAGDFTQSGGSNTISGTGTVTLSDGTTLLAGTLALGDAATGSGTYQLGSGALSASAELVGVAGSGGITQTGGTNSTGTLNLTGAISTYALNGGGLTAGTVSPK